MSESIYICAASLCCSLVACAVIRIILPSGNTERIMTVVLSVFVLCCLFGPLVDLIGNSDFGFSEEDLIVSEEAAVLIQDDVVIEETAKYINEYINGILVSKGIENSEIKTVLSKNNEGGIYIKEVNIYLNKAYLEKSGDVRKWISESLGIEPEVSEC